LSSPLPKNSPTKPAKNGPKKRENGGKIITFPINPNNNTTQKLPIFSFLAKRTICVIHNIHGKREKNSRILISITPNAPQANKNSSIIYLYLYENIWGE
jgi:hypothetical protein